MSALAVQCIARELTQALERVDENEKGSRVVALRLTNYELDALCRIIIRQAHSHRLAVAIPLEATLDAVRAAGRL